MMTNQISRSRTTALLGVLAALNLAFAAVLIVPSYIETCTSCPLWCMMASSFGKVPNTPSRHLTTSPIQDSAHGLSMLAKPRVSLGSSLLRHLSNFTVLPRVKLFQAMLFLLSI